MNKQEAIDLVKNTSYSVSINNSVKYLREETVVNIIKQLDEPKKPVIPQFVANWIEGAKNNGFYLLEIMTLIEAPEETERWISNNSETFAKAWLYGYKVEKEKIYTVELPNPNKIGNEVNALMMNGFRQIVIKKEFGDGWKKENGFQLTEAEIKKNFDWAWQFAKEVEK